METFTDYYCIAWYDFSKKLSFYSFIISCTQVSVMYRYARQDTTVQYYNVLDSDFFETIYYNRDCIKSLTFFLVCG